MKVDEPIVIPDNCWTKERIWDQLGFEDEGETILFTAEEIPDNIAVEWVNKHDDLLCYFPSQENYVDEVDELNEDLIKKVLKSLGR